MFRIPADKAGAESTTITEEHPPRATITAVCSNYCRRILLPTVGMKRTADGRS